MVSLLLSNRFPCLGDICRMLLYENHVWTILLYIKVFKSCCISIHFEWSHIVGYLLSLESACGIQMLTSNLDFLDRWEQGNSSSPTKNGLWHSPIREKKTIWRKSCPVLRFDDALMVLLDFGIIPVAIFSDVHGVSQTHGFPFICHLIGFHISFPSFLHFQLLKQQKRSMKNRSQKPHKKKNVSVSLASMDDVRLPVKSMNRIGIIVWKWCVGYYYASRLPYAIASDVQPHH